MNKGFDTNELEVDNKFGKASQDFAKIIYYGKDRVIIVLQRLVGYKIDYVILDLVNLR